MITHFGFRNDRKGKKKKKIQKGCMKQQRCRKQQGESWSTNYIHTANGSPKSKKYLSGASATLK